MTCKYCGGDSSVTDTASSDEFVVRRRVCKECKKAFFTIEQDYDNDAEATTLLNQLKKAKKNTVYGQMLTPGINYEIKKGERIKSKAKEVFK